MKRLAIFIGGLLVLPAFAEVAPIFIDEENALEYTDAMYDENGFLIIPDAEVVEEVEETAAQKTQTPVKISRAPVNATTVANRSTATRATPAAGRANTSGRGSAAGNSSRVVAARTTTNTSARGNTSRAVASRGAVATSPRTTTTAATSSTRATTNTAATRAAAARATGGSARLTTATVSGTGVARTATTAGRSTTASRAGTARTATTTTAARAATTTTGAARPSVRTNLVGSGVKDNQIGTPVTLGEVTSDGVIYKQSKAASIRRTPTLRMSTLNSTSADANSISMSMEDMDDLAEMTDYCKAQYANCMDNYCNVLDDNQGRCSCSANLKNYAKAEAALKTATEELQDVAQKIQYIGLTTREVETLFTQTEAELAMQSKTDSSQLQASLNKVKDMIVEVKTGTATSDTNTGLSFDLSGLLEFSFDSTGFDLMSLFGTSNTGSVSNQRGEELYKTASSRCKTSVIKACTARGVDASLITNAYDLEIDRECIMYERSLNDSNDEMLATVRNAKNVLQKARLMVAQQKNAYDMRGCINALDACMQDEFVCGSDYENCLDPTGRYIVNGDIVIGSQPGHAIDPELSNRVASVMTSDVCRVNLYRTWDFPGKTCREHGDADYLESGQTSPNYMSYPTYDQYNAWGSGTGDNLVAYIDETVTANAAKNASENMSQYLQNKIGYVNQKDGRAYGMCISVLNKCQDYTYTGKGTSAKYDPQNDVIKQYLGRVLVQIKSKQDEILANYAETCVSDVTSCLSQNGYPSDDPLSWDPSEYTTNITKMNIAINACRAQVVTCMSVNGYSIDTPTPTEMNCWVQGLLFNYTTEDCRDYHSSTISCGPTTRRLCNSDNCETDGEGYWCAEKNSCVASENECNNSTNACSYQHPELCSKPECEAITSLVWCSNGEGECMKVNERDRCPYIVNLRCQTGSSTVTPDSSPKTGYPRNPVTLDGCPGVDDGYSIGTWSCSSGYGTLNSANNTFQPTKTGATCTRSAIDNGSTTKYDISLTCGGNCNAAYASKLVGSFPRGSQQVIPTCASVQQSQTWVCSTGTLGSNSGNFTVSGDLTCEANCNSIEIDDHPVLVDCEVNRAASSQTTYTVQDGGVLSLSGKCPEVDGYDLNDYDCYGDTTGNHQRINITGSLSNITEAYTCYANYSEIGGGSSGHTFTASCDNCNGNGTTGQTIAQGSNITFNQYCTAPTNQTISWACNGSPVNATGKVQMPGYDYYCSATCSGGSSGGETDKVTLIIDCIDGTVNNLDGHTATGSSTRKTVTLDKYDTSITNQSQPNAMFSFHGGYNSLYTATCKKDGYNVKYWHCKTGSQNVTAGQSWSGWDSHGNVQNQNSWGEYSFSSTSSTTETCAPEYESLLSTVVKVDCGSRATIGTGQVFSNNGYSGTIANNTFTINPFNGATFSLDKAYCNCGENQIVNGWTRFVGNNAIQTIEGSNPQGVSITQNATNTFTPICVNDSADLANNIYQCPPENGLTLNASVLDSYVQTNGYTNSSYNATSGTYSFTSPAGQIATAPANACICENGSDVGEWVVSSKQVTRGKANSYKPGVEKVTMEAGHTYTFHANCDDDDDEEDCDFTLEPGENCSGENKTISCYIGSATVQQFGPVSQEWSCTNNSTALQNALNNLGNGKGYGMLNISQITSSTPITDGTQCVATCAQSSSETVTVTIDCGNGDLNPEVALPVAQDSFELTGTSNNNTYIVEVPVNASIRVNHKLCNCPGSGNQDGAADDWTITANGETSPIAVNTMGGGISITSATTLTAICPTLGQTHKVDIYCNTCGTASAQFPAEGEQVTLSCGDNITPTWSCVNADSNAPISMNGTNTFTMPGHSVRCDATCGVYTGIEMGNDVSF